MSKKQPRLYVAYGSNLNIAQMAYRCPTAKLYATGEIRDYELQFKGQPHGAFATIARKAGASVPVAVWEIQQKDEYYLDRYEGYPSHYFKRKIPVELKDGRQVNAMVYVMNLRMNFGMPSTHYYRTVHQGYLDCRLNTNALNEALGNSAQKFYSSAVSDHLHQLSMDFPNRTPVDEDFDENDYEIECDEEEEQDEEQGEEPDETDPFYFSDGMHW